MDFEDARRGRRAAGREDCSDVELAELAELERYLARARCCSLCANFFRLQTSLGVPVSMHPERDHVDYSTELAEHVGGLCLPEHLLGILDRQLGPSCGFGVTSAMVRRPAESEPGAPKRGGSVCLVRKLG